MAHDELVVLDEVVRVDDDVNQVDDRAPVKEHLLLANGLLDSGEQLPENDAEREDHEVEEVNDSDEPDYSLSGVVNTAWVVESGEEHTLGETFSETLLQVELEQEIVVNASLNIVVVVN